MSKDELISERTDTYEYYWFANIEPERSLIVGDFRTIRTGISGLFICK